MIHIIVNRFYMISYWEWNIGPIISEKCEHQFALYYSRVTILDFVTVHTHTVDNKYH